VPPKRSWTLREPVSRVGSFCSPGGNDAFDADAVRDHEADVPIRRGAPVGALELLSDSGIMAEGRDLLGVGVDPHRPVPTLRIRRRAPHGFATRSVGTTT
jgi:hypothetical protein